MVNTELALVVADQSIPSLDMIILVPLEPVVCLAPTATTNGDGGEGVDVGEGVIVGVKLNVGVLVGVIVLVGV